MRSLASRFARVLALASLALAAGGSAAAQGGVYREIRIDLSGLPPGAIEARRTVGACLARNLPLAFAGRVSPGARGAPVLVVRPTSVWLAPVFALSDDRFGGRSSNSISGDYMEGEAIVGGARLAVAVAGAAPDPSPIAAADQAAARTEQLCQSFAYWLARRI